MNAPARCSKFGIGGVLLTKMSPSELVPSSYADYRTAVYRKIRLPTVVGAIFQLNKGQGRVLESELSTEGAHIARSEDESAISNTQERKK